MLVLELLGTLSLRGDTHPVPLAAQQKRRLGLLAILALGGRQGLSRDRIEAYLWPESSGELARHALDQAVYAIRHALGSDFILSTGRELRLNPGFIHADVWDFEEAIRARDWTTAAGIYRGTLLEGFHFADSRELESWIDAERARLRLEYQTAIEFLANRSAEAGDHPQSVAWWRKLANSDPLSAGATKRLMLALAAAGDRAGAVRHARNYQALVRQELEIEPDSEIERLASTFSHPGITETAGTEASEVADALRAPASNSGETLTTASESLLKRRWDQRPVRIATSIGAGIVVTIAILAVAERKTLSASVFPATRDVAVSASGNLDASASSANGPINTVAVIPFANTGGNPQDEYFSDGMTDELAYALSRLPGVRVAGRSSSYAFKGKSLSAQEIGKALNVSSVVEASVRRSGQRLRLIVELTSTKSGQIMWSAPFESSTASDVFQVQDNFTRAIVGALTPALGARATADAASTSRGTDDPEAYDLYLRGRYFFARRGAAGLKRAIAYFAEAAAKDPKFARARAGMSMAYGVIEFFASVSTDSTRALALKNGEMAVALDSSLGDAHLALANVLTVYTRLNDADVEYQRALKLQPDDPTTHEWYGENLSKLGRVDEALAEERRAEALDPLSPVIAVEVSMALFITRRFREASTWSLRALELDSTLTLAEEQLDWDYIFAGQAEKGVQVMERSFARDPGQSASRGNMILSYAASGRWDDVRGLYRELTRKSAHASDDDLLDAYLAVGDRQKALDVFEHMSRHGIGDLGPGCDPSLDLLHNEPRYLAVIHRFGVGLCPVMTAWPIKPPPAGWNAL
jgi:DNA-binding SARP family transcriptional activator/TolB-like protein